MSTFTLEKLMEAKRLIDAAPPVPFFAKSELFPRDRAMSFKADGRDYAGAHPDFWAKIPASDRGQYQSLFAIEVVDLDLEVNRARKAEFFRGMARAFEERRGG